MRKLLDRAHVGSLLKLPRYLALVALVTSPLHLAYAERPGRRIEALRDKIGEADHPERTRRESSDRAEPIAQRIGARSRRLPKVYRPKAPLEIGVIGLRESGAGDAIARRLLLGGHSIVGFDRQTDTRAALAKDGAVNAHSVADLIDRLPIADGKPRVVWLTHALGKQDLATIEKKLGRGDIVIDSSDSTMAEIQARAAKLADKGIELVDVGLSGTVDGFDRGFGLAIGGHKKAVKQVQSLFESLAPGRRTGWAHITNEAGEGVVGGGHLVRTVEGAVDNAFREALKEGLDVISKGEIPVDEQRALETWSTGSILTSELVGRALDLVSDGGNYRDLARRDTADGAETYRYAVDNGAPNLVLSAALFEQAHFKGSPPVERPSRLAARRASAGRKALDRTVPKVYQPKEKLTVGVVGLGRIGGGVSHRLLGGGHSVVGFDSNAGPRSALEKQGGASADSLESLVASLPVTAGKPRTVFVYLPAGKITEQTIARLSELLSPGDIIVDGGNSPFRRTIELGKELKDSKDITLVDIGTSGGVLGYQNGYAMMVGGPNRAIDYLTPALESLAPGKNVGWAHIRDHQGNGISGGGHFVKMVHNGIEYAWMAALAEGLDDLRRGPSKINPRKVLKVWDERSPLASLITAITRRQIDRLGSFEGLSNRVPDTGEGRGTADFAAIGKKGVPIPIAVLSNGLLQRLSSQALLDDTTDVGAIQNQTREGFNGSPAPKTTSARPDLTKGPVSLSRP